MPLSLLLKAALVWLGIACLAVANGTFRQYVLLPSLGLNVALPLSGLTLAILIFLMAYLCFGFLGPADKASCLFIGAQWVLMTLAFEFLFGHFVVGKSWSTLLQTFNVLKGDMFTLVVVATFFAPYWVGKIKGAI